MLNLAPLVCPISIRLGSAGKGLYRMESAQRRLGHGQSPSERRQDNTLVTGPEPGAVGTREPVVAA